MSLLIPSEFVPQLLPFGGENVLPSISKSKTPVGLNPAGSSEIGWNTRLPAGSSEWSAISALVIRRRLPSVSSTHPQAESPWADLGAYSRRKVTCCLSLAYQIM